MLNLHVQKCKHLPNLAAEIGHVSQLPQRFWKETRWVLYCLIYVSNTIALVSKKKYHHCPIKIKYIIYKKTPKKHKSPTLTKVDTSWDNVGTFWHDLQPHNRIPNWERMALWKLLLVLALQPVWHLQAIALSKGKTEKWKEWQTQRSCLCVFCSPGLLLFSIIQLE